MRTRGRGSGLWVPSAGVLLLAASTALGGLAARRHGVRVVVPPHVLRVMDGDTAEIRWSTADVETVRVLGIDTPELLPQHTRDWSKADPRGTEARGFARGAFATAGRVELKRCGQVDRFRRTLGYFFLDGRNYSVLALEAGMARETISRYGHNGLPNEAREVLRAAGRSPASVRGAADSAR